MLLLLLAAALATAATSCAPSPATLAERELERLLGDDAKTVDVSIDGSKATLTGAVQNRSTRTISEEITLAQPGIESVDNKVTVPERQPLERMYMVSVDNGMLMRVEFVLLRSVGPSAIKALQARAVDGIVSFRGPVPSEAVRRAIVTTTYGVEDVRNVIDLMTVSGARAGEQPAKAPTSPEPSSPPAK